MSETAFRSRSLKRVGRDGYALLEYVKNGDKTQTKKSVYQNPLQVFPSIHLEHEKYAYTQILNPCGGMLAGDRFMIEVHLEAQAHALITTPSASRVYRSQGEPSIQFIDIEIGPHAVLEWIPDLLIPFSDSWFQQRILARLSPGATLFLWDAFSSGRIGSGEKWSFSKLSNKIQIEAGECGEVFEQYELKPQEMLPYSAYLQEDWDYHATFYFISLAENPIDWALVIDELSRWIEHSRDRIRAGVSRLSIPGIVIRLASKSAVDLSSGFTALWNLGRQAILGLSAPRLRKY